MVLTSSDNVMEYEMVVVNTQLYSGFSIIQTAVCQYNLNSVRISELVRISEQPFKSYCVT